MQFVIQAEEGGRTFTVSEEALKYIPVVYGTAVVADDPTGSVLVIPKAGGNTYILEMIVAWAEFYSQPSMERRQNATPAEKQELSEKEAAWDKQYYDLSTQDLHDLLMAAYFLDMKALIDFLTGVVASYIKGKTAAEIRAKFNIVSDFTPEEEAKIESENQWLKLNAA